MLNLPAKVVEGIRRQITLAEVSTKMTFTDFLSLLQKEAFFRECLSDCQMYKLSAKRMIYGQECALITAQQLEILK